MATWFETRFALLTMTSSWGGAKRRLEGWNRAVEVAL